MCIIYGVVFKVGAARAHVGCLLASHHGMLGVSFGLTPPIAQMATPGIEQHVIPGRYIAREEPLILNILIVRSETRTIYVSLFQLVGILGNVIRHVLVVYQQKSQLQAMETY